MLALFWSPPKELSQDKRQLAETSKGIAPKHLLDINARTLSH
jgi:hypothetical protein